MKKIFKELVGAKIISVDDNDYEINITLNNGKVIHINESDISKAPIKKEPKTFTDFLRSIGIKNFYIDNRKNQEWKYRIKPTFYSWWRSEHNDLKECTSFKFQIDKLKLPQVKTEIESWEKPIHIKGKSKNVILYRLIVRTKNRPSKILIKNKNHVHN